MKNSPFTGFPKASSFGPLRFRRNRIFQSKIGIGPLQIMGLGPFRILIRGYRPVVLRSQVVLFYFCTLL